MSRKMQKNEFVFFCRFFGFLQLGTKPVKFICFLIIRIFFIIFFTFTWRFDEFNFIYFVQRCHFINIQWIFNKMVQISSTGFTQQCFFGHLILSMQVSNSIFTNCSEPGKFVHYIRRLFEPRSYVFGG
jgi:hypothetical protein